MVSLLITFFLVSIVFSFLCSMWEAVLLSVTPAYAKIRLKEGRGIGAHLYAFKKDIDRPLAAILTLNTIAHTVGAIGVGVQASLIWEKSHPFLTGAVVPVVMTLAILILSELIPKTLGANHWERLVPFTVRSLQLVIAALYPLVWLSQRITRTLKKDKKRSALSRSDFVAMAEIGAEEGIFHEVESGILQNMLRFESVRARDIMTPRIVVVAEPEAMTVREFFSAHPNLRFSRVPTFEMDSKDRVTGYFLKDRMLGELANGRNDRTLGDIKRPIQVVVESTPLPSVFEQLMREREHIALVVDEYGGMAGVVTMEDVIETMLGLEIVDESDPIEDMQILARRVWERRARSMGLLDDGSTPTEE